ncbi:hypothetical protein KFE25_006956 [Diacronema lutheri]|uniref:Transcription factor IIIC subunit 5 HTH domain-containing protein n=1 Tax=Diacronema lutheri TaxID=2081491 RepID=A0A8J6CCT6_DIALT|nr:hypothetical protein KFE25_006956 [Diacronema lutheri]
MSLDAAGELPNKGVLLVDYPGYVADAGRAIETLGGLGAISTVSRATERASDSLLHLRLRPNDPYSHPIFGQKVPMAALLLRVRRPGAADSTALGTLPSPRQSASATVVARVQHAVRFGGMADFQYIVRGQRSVCAELDAAASLTPPGADLDLEIPPTLFSPVDVVQEYALTWGGKRLLTTALRDKKRYKPVPDRPQPLSRVDLTLQAPVPTAKPPPKLTDSAHRAYDRLTALFARRPIWTRLALDKALGGPNAEPTSRKWAVKEALPLVAYYCITGPWSRCYVRLGYDPRVEPLSYEYQALDVRLFHSAEPARRRRAARRAGRVAEQALLAELVPRKTGVVQRALPSRIRQHALHASRGRAHAIGDDGDDSAADGAAELAPQQRQLNYQLCDMPRVCDERQKAVLDQAYETRSRVYDPKHGWFSADTLAALRAIVKEQLLAQQAGAHADDGRAGVTSGTALSARPRAPPGEQRAPSDERSARAGSAQGPGHVLAYPMGDAGGIAVVDAVLCEPARPAPLARDTHDSSAATAAAVGAAGAGSRSLSNSARGPHGSARGRVGAHGGELEGEDDAMAEDSVEEEEEGEELEADDEDCEEVGVGADDDGDDRGDDNDDDADSEQDRRGVAASADAGMLETLVAWQQLREARADAAAGGELPDAFEVFDDDDDDDDDDDE